MLPILAAVLGKQVYDSLHLGETSSRSDSSSDDENQDADNYTKRADECIRLCQYKKGLEFARKAIKDDPKNVRGYLQEAECLLITGEIDDAISCYNKALKVEPANTDVKNLLSQAEHVHECFTTGSESFKTGDYRQTVQHMEQCLQVCNESHRFKLLKAECLAYLRQFKESQKIAEDILRSDNRNTQAIHILGLCRYQIDEETGLQYFKEVLQLAPDHMKANDALKTATYFRQKEEEGNEAFRNDKYQEAYRLYTEVLEHDQRNVFTNAKLYCSRAKVLSKLNKTEQAIKDFSSAIELDDTYIKAYDGRAKCYMDSEQFYKAMVDQVKMSKIEKRQRPSYQPTADFYTKRASTWIASCYYKMALEYARKAIKVDPQYIMGYMQEAECLLVMGNIKDAINCYNKALKIEPTNADVKNMLSQAEHVHKFLTTAMECYENGDYSKTVQHLEQCLQVCNESQHLKFLKAECLAYLRQFKESKDIIDDILSNDKENAEAVFIQGLCFYYRNDEDKGLEHFMQVLRLAPDHQKANDAIKKARCLRQKKEKGNEAFGKKKYQEACRLYTEALELDKLNVLTNAKLYCNRATVLTKLNKPEQAIKDYSSAIELDNAYLKAYLGRAKSYMTLAEFEKAVKDYEEALKIENTAKNRQLLEEAKLELKKTKRKDYYRIIGVAPNATDDVIKTQWRNKARYFHPDKNPIERKEEFEEKLKELNEAYMVLSDPLKKARYDRGCDIKDL